MSNAAGRPPVLNTQCIVKFLKSIFPFTDIDEDSIKPLPSYEDRNYYFRGTLDYSKVEDGSNYVPGTHDCSGEDCSHELEYVLKVHNLLFSSFEVIKGLNVMLRHLSSKGFSCIRPLPSRSGEDALLFKGKDLLGYDSEEESGVPEETRNNNFAVRVVTFIPGELLDEIEKRYITPKLLYEVGNYVGRVAEQLQELDILSLKSRNLKAWNLMNFLDIQQYLEDVDDPNERRIAEQVFSDFKKHVVPKIPSFKKSIIYGDANGLNIVVKKNAVSDEYELAGLIDFGDCVYSCCIFDLGILLAYIMLENISPKGGESTVEFIAPMLCGYINALPFSQEEISSLYYIVMARCCQSAVLGTHNFKIEPWNTYLLTTPKKAFKLLQQMVDTPKEIVDRIWNQALEKTHTDTTPTAGHDAMCNNSLVLMTAQP